MRKIKFFKIINTAFRLLLLFSLSFIWMRYFFKDLALSIIFAVFLTALIDLLLYTLFRRKQAKTSLKAKELKECEDMFLSLLLNKNSIAFFEKLATSKHKCEKHKDHLIVTEGDSRVALFPRLQLAPLTADGVVELYKSCQTKLPNLGKIVIVCGTAEKDAYSVASKLNHNILILDKHDTYKKLYKEYNTYPSAISDFKPVKNETIKSLLAYSFNKKRTKAYFFSALVLLFSSFLIGSSVYYIVMSSLLLLFAIISYYNPMFNKKAEEKIF